MKQKLVMKKYEHIEKITKVCKNSKHSIMETLTYLLEIFDQNEKMFRVDKFDHANLFKKVELKKR